LPPLLLLALHTTLLLLLDLLCWHPHQPPPLLLLLMRLSALWPVACLEAFRPHNLPLLLLPLLLCLHRLLLVLVQMPYACYLVLAVLLLLLLLQVMGSYPSGHRPRCCCLSLQKVT
jgi:hypothetical protein